MSEVNHGAHDGREDKNLGGLPFPGEKAKLSKRRQIPVVKGQETLDSLLESNAPKDTSKIERRKLAKKEKIYNVRPGVDYRTGPMGSDAGDYAGTITEPTRVRVVGKKSVHSGIGSFYGVFDVNGEQKTGWFAFDDIKSKVKAKP